MRLVVLCGMPWEASVLTAALPGITILSGTAKNNLDTLVPSDTTHLVSCGLMGGLSHMIEIADVAVAGTIATGTRELQTDEAWNWAILFALKAAPGPRREAIGDQFDMETPLWAQRAIICPWYSSGQMDQADTTQQRAALLAATGAWAIDDETFAAATYAKAKGIKFAVMRSCSDDASETLPLAMRGQIMNANGSANLEYLLSQIITEPAGQTVMIPKIVADFNASLATLQAAAPALLESLT